MPMRRVVPFLLLAAFLSVVAGPPARVEAQSIQERLEAVVRVRTFVPPDARTADSLGRERLGSGVVIDQAGLVLTIGYLMVEADGAEVTLSSGRAMPAQVVGYDHESGFGLLRTLEPARVRPARLGRSSELKERDPVLVASFGGASGAQPGFVVSRRPFAGNWEYLIEDAIYTAPPHPHWSGAALFDGEGRLMGIGSLIIGDVSSPRVGIPGNMFVPIDRLPPILADLIADGAPQGPRKPWMGLSTEEHRGRLFVARVTPEGPASRAGIAPGDMITAVAGRPPTDLADLYRKVWALGDAGTEIPLTVLRGSQLQEIRIKSVDRHTHLKLKRTY